MSAQVRDQKRTSGRVGEFYNHLGASLIGGQTSYVHDGSNPDACDAYNPRLKVCLEAKGAGNGNAWHLTLHQMERAMRNKKRSHVYFLAGYKSIVVRRGWNPIKDKGKRSRTHSVLPQLRSKQALFNFLAEKTDSAHLVEFGFLQMLREKGIGREKMAFGFREGHEHFELRRKELRRFVSPSDEILMSIGILPGEWVFRTLTILKRFNVRSFSNTQFGGRTQEYPIKMEFLLHTILSPELDAKLVREVKKNDDSDMPF